MVTDGPNLPRLASLWCFTYSQPDLLHAGCTYVQPVCIVTPSTVNVGQTAVEKRSVNQAVQAEPDFGGCP